MAKYGSNVVAVIDTQSNFGVTFNQLKTNVDTLVGQMSTLLADAPETLDTLNEIAAAISDDPAFFTTMVSANTTLQANIDALSTAAANARAALQTALQTAIDANALTSTNAEAALGVRLDSLELDPVTKTYVDAAVTNLIDAAPAVLDTLNEIAAAIGDDANFVTTITDSIAAVQADVDANQTASESADSVLGSRLDVLEADPTTKTYVDTQVAGLIDSAPGVLNTLDELAAALGDDANFATTITNSIAAVQADVDQNETDSDAADSALSGRLDVLEADPTTATALAAVQADVDANETASDAAEAALSTRLDTLEADPTTATAVAAVQADVDSIEAAASTARTNLQNTLQAAIDSVQADVNTNESDADAAIALKYDKAGGTVTGNVVIAKSFPDFELKSGDEKRVLFTDAGGGATAAIKHVGTSLDFYAGGIASGNKEFVVASTGVTVSAAVTLSGGLTDAANDSAAASAGIDVGQLYRNGSVVMIRVS